MSHPRPPRDDEADRRFDEALRDSLSPSIETRRRIIQHALAAPDDALSPARQRDFPHSRWRHASRRGWPWLAAAAATLAIALAQLHYAPTLDDPLSAIHPPEPPERLRITNEDGPVVVTTTSGNRLIMLDTTGAQP